MIIKMRLTPYRTIYFVLLSLYVHLLLKNCYVVLRRTDVDAASGTKSGTLKFVRTLTNISKDAGGIAHMRCEVVGDPPPTKIRWFKNEAPLEEDRPKITIRKIHAQVRGPSAIASHSRRFYKVFTNARERIFLSRIESNRIEHGQRRICRNEDS